MQEERRMHSKTSLTEQVLEEEVLNTAISIFTAPVNHSEIVPTVLPLILAGLIVELYLGKYKREDLGWNTAVGNAVVWFATGVSLLVTESLEGLEAHATFFLIFLGLFVGFMDFFHLWPEQIAFLISSSGLVYTIAYTIVVMIKTSIEINNATLLGAGVFIALIQVAFLFLKLIEQPRDDFSI
jgi:hypothetical protein